MYMYFVRNLIINEGNFCLFLKWVDFVILVCLKWYFYLCVDVLFLFVIIGLEYEVLIRYIIYNENIFLVFKFC